nr:hypothetical protein [Candidatus Gracilibacteria bacterium]
MLGLINLLKKRPTDKTILLSRIIFGLVYIGLIYYNLIYLNKSIETNYFWVDVSEEKLLYIKYGFLAVGIIPIIMGITNICLLKSKYIRIIQIAFSFILFYISGKIASSPTLDVDILIGLMGIFPLLAGITGKCITTKCMKYGEKITKVRV